MPDDRITARFSVRLGREVSNLTVAELAALMTGLSRSLNKMYLGRTGSTDPQGGSINPIGYEPTAIALELVSIRSGSVIVDSAVTVLSGHPAAFEAARELALGGMALTLATAT